MTSAYHHVGVRVGDLASAIEFYQGAFDARVLVGPYVVQGEVADRITGHHSARMRMCQLGFDGDSGGFLELFHFEPEELAPSVPLPYTHQRVLHFGIQVDNVPEALARVERLGGSRVFDPRHMEDVTFCYCRDRDDNVIELADGPMRRIVSIVEAREQR